MEHVFGYTIINDISSRDPWLDGDQWLLGKSMPGFCPVGPWVVTARRARPGRPAPRLHDQRRSRSRTAGRRRCASRSPRSIAYLSRHIDASTRATSSPPARRRGSTGRSGPDRHLQPGDVVTVWIEGIGELTTTIA